ncbi:acyl-CoA dehydrogenase family protein [Halocalculus aciditolerans]|uniref:Acyl-CoA dehydrogenase n=1 Tax=Halocalculus aciditolerans TaxID=1383812 RepID=A0A830F9V1_9EURY|nr:acyl-CoA dehydrogenase family protein [Halocalculus aciditolerans]GGL53412.1 acyl-CoA dehydrogenase [Halocalculus aciditolerans]
MPLSGEQAAVRDLVREFAEEEIAPVAAECDEEARFPEGVWDGLADLDLTSLTVPEAYGGYDADKTTYSVVNEQVAYGSLAVATALSVHSLATSCIAEFGSESVKEEWLPEMADGRPVGAFALSEPGAGSNPAQMTTTARREGDEYVINGTKQWITNGERSGVVLLFAKVDDGSEGTTADSDAVTQFLVPKDTPGLSVGKKEEKLGLRASDTTSLEFDDAHIPAEYRLTEVGRGLSAAFSILTTGRIGIASQAVGLAQAALDDAVEYAGEREQFGKAIGEIQSVRHKLADMETQVRAGRALVREAAELADAGEDFRQAASAAKLYASEAAVDVTNEAVQVHGGYGYTTDFDVERYYRDSKITTIYEGTSEIQKEVIARGLLD